MRVYIIDFFKDSILKEMQSDRCIVPQNGAEVYFKGNRYKVVSHLYDFDSMRVQVYVESI